MYPSPWSGSRRSSLAVIFKKSLLRQLRAIPKPPIFVHLSGVSALQLVVHSGAMDFQLRCDLRRTEPYSIQSFKFHAVFQHEMSFTQPARLLFCWLFDKKINAGKLLSSSLAFILIIQQEKQAKFVCKSKCNPTIAFSLTNLSVAFTRTNAGVGFITH